MANEKRLIDAWDLIEWLDKIDLENMHRLLRGKKAKWLDTKGVRHMIDNIPEVDAVEVIRCKDCKHGGILEHTGNVYCKNPLGRNGCVPTKSDAFCSYGERKDNEID